MKRLFYILILCLLYSSLNAKEIPYHFNNTFKISVSDKMELRKSDDFYTKILGDSGIIEYNNNSIIFQQKGLSDMTKKSLDTYCRILIDIFDDEDGEYPNATDSHYTTEDFNYFEQLAFKNIVPPQQIVKQPISHVLWQNGYCYLKVNYTRTGDKGNVEVAMHYLFNVKKFVRITTAYRISEANIWQDVVNNAFKSFEWDNIYKTTSFEYQPQPDNSYSYTPTNNQSNNNKDGFPTLFTVLSMIIIIIVVVFRTKSNNNSIDTEKPLYTDYQQPKQLKKIEYPSKINSTVYSIPKETISTPTTINQTELVFVQYNLSDCSDNSQYVITKVPKNGTIVYPYRRKKTQRRGFTEIDFETKLRNSLPANCNFLVLGDTSILPASYERPYEPDIAIIEKSDKYGIRIDIEIDEPYSAVDHKPIHYIGCGDEYRDRVLNSFGWIVIRFSERQIFLESNKCISYIQRILTVADYSFHRNVPFDQPDPEKRWTKLEATIMIAQKSREKLLNHNFEIIESEPEPQNRLRLNNVEIEAHKYVKPVEFQKDNYTNIDGSSVSYDQDAELVFEPFEHIYRYGDKVLKPVSNVVLMFFKEFDALSMSEYKSGGNIRDQIKLMETWECNGAKSREVGTQMHLVIENYFKNKPIPDSYHFSFNGQYVNVDETISLKTEIKYFHNFLNDHPTLIPFRTEWRICDLKNGIAGSIDFICRNGNNYYIFDWKRSKKSSPDERIYQHGINGLEDIPDISYWHYALQQNLYRYILQQNYGVQVAKMHIVIIHPDYPNYKVYEIPTMDKEIRLMLDHLSSQ